MFSSNVYWHRQLFLAAWCIGFWSSTSTKSPLLQAPKNTPQAAVQQPVSQGKPQSLTPQEAAQKIAGHRVILYTGTNAMDNLTLSPYRTKLNVITCGDLLELMHTITAKEARQVDYIVIIGLGLDESGFLEWYKKQNPNGRFIAVNTVTAAYLGDEDFYVDEDLQSTLPPFFESCEWEETEM